jgi:tetratricopeptide (TPR) repeat protein
MSKSSSAPRSPARPSANGGAWPKRRSLLLAAVVAAAAAAGGWWFWAPRLRADREWRAAQQCLERDDFPAARRALLQCQEMRPQDAAVHFALARMERRAGDLAKARDQLQEARRLGWPADQIELEQTLMQAQAGGVMATAARLRSAVNGDDLGAALAYEALVKGWIQHQAIAEAYLACDAWLKRFPAAWRAHFWMGWILEKQVKHALALEHYRAAHQGNPEDIGIRFRYAETLLNLSEFSRALPELETCLQARPDDPACRFAAARCFQGLGRNEEAETLLSGLIREKPDHGPALFALAQLHIAADDPTGALEYARRAVNLDPDNPVRAALLAEALRGVHDPEANKWAEKARNLVERNERVASLTAAANADPRDATARLELGKYLASLGRKDEAARWFRAALAIDANLTPAREALEALAAPGGSGPANGEASAQKPPPGPGSP